MNLTWRTATLEEKRPPDTIMSTDKRVIDQFEYLDFLDRNGGQADRAKITQKFRDADTLGVRDELQRMDAVKVVLVSTGGRTKGMVTITDAGREILAKSRASLPVVIPPVPDPAPARHATETPVTLVVTSFLPSVPIRPGPRCPSCGEPVAAASVGTVCILCGHWHGEEPKEGCSCCQRAYDDSDGMFAFQGPTASDVLFAMFQAGQPVNRQDMITRFAEEYHSRVGDLFDTLVSGGRVVRAGIDDETGNELYRPITLEEGGRDVRELPVPTNNVIPPSVVLGLWPGSLIASARDTFTWLQRTVVDHLSRLGDLGWIVEARSWRYGTGWTIRSLLAGGRATDIDE